MKALLKTRCGCTRMVDMVDQAPEVSIPLYQAERTAGRRMSEKDCQVEKRVFRFTKHLVVEDVTLLLYEER